MPLFPSIAWFQSVRDVYNGDLLFYDAQTSNKGDFNRQLVGGRS